MTDSIPMNETTLRLSRNFQELMKFVDAAVTEAAGEHIGFAIVIFTEGRGSYGSNVKRETVIAEFQKLLESWNAGLPDIPAHKVS